jgi:hypothetical protein
MQLLCPWRHPDHRELYVAIDNTEQEFIGFVRKMGDLATLLEHGQLVLVTGESGCGKSALINRCADWASTKLKGLGWVSEVLDLTRTLNGMPQQSIENRLSSTCSALITELEMRGALRSDAVSELRPDRDRPDQIFPRLHRALIDDLALIILLPNPGDLKNEVIRYAGLARGRILFLVESAFLGERDVEAICHAQRDWIRPITLRVGVLNPGDVVKFVTHRLRIRSNQGIYPRMSETTMNFVADWLPSIAQLQLALSEVYEIWRHSGPPYDERSWVTDDDIRRQRRNWRGDGR